jgi:Methyltransferase domain
MNCLYKLANVVSRISLPGLVKSISLAAIIKLNNRLVDFKKSCRRESSGLREFDEILDRVAQRTVINDHVVTLFLESLSVRPKLIVELGVEAGQSTFVFERVARLCGSRLVSVDFYDCSGSCDWDEWIFVKANDIEFAERFPEWCRERNIGAEIDILFIDTDHNYEQTLKEIKAWFPLLSSKAKVFFHDSNVVSVLRRKDGSLGNVKRDFNRGVIRAIGEYLGGSFDEKEDFIRFCNGWLVKHHSNCNGMTILEKTEYTLNT